MKTGLVLGKFMPLHNGHIALIEFAIKYCDELIVLICASNTEPIHGSQRLDWVTETFKLNIKIKPLLLSYDESILPNTSESSRAISEIWANSLKDYLPSIDIFFASEAYAAYMGEFLNCEYKTFDIPRDIVPISSTQIRKSPFKYWDLIPAAVKPHYAKKVCLYGTESTGKTTIAQKLADYFDTKCVIEMAREVLENTYECTEVQLTEIAELHAKTIEVKIKEANKILFVDTDVHITRSYSRFLFHKELVVADWVDAANKFDLYLYLDNDAPYIQDGTRLTRVDRDLLNESHKIELINNDIKFELLTGSWADKFEKAKSQAQKLLAG